MTEYPESAPAIVKTGGYQGVEYPRGEEAKTKNKILKWLIIGGVLFVLVDAVAVAYAVLNRDTLMVSQNEYVGRTGGAPSLSAAIYR